MRRIAVSISSAAVLFTVMVISLLSGAGSLFISSVSAAQLTSRSLEISDSKAAQISVTYNIGFNIVTAGTLGSMQLLFCSNSSLPTEPCTAPNGFDASNAVFSMETGVSGLSISNASTANDLILTRPPAPSAAVPVTLTFTNITNPTDAGSYYLRVLTYPTNDATGPYTDNGGMAFDMNAAVNVHVQVPPYLLFCTGNTIVGTDCSTAAGDFIDMGPLGTSRTSSGTSQMVIATNAQNGYNISANGGTLTSGNNTIASLSTASPAQTGVSQFGINLRANSKPSVGTDPSGGGIGTPTANYNQPNLYTYNNGDTVATANGVTDYRKFTVSYIVNISSQQPAGVYASTFTYVALSNF